MIIYVISEVLRLLGCWYPRQGAIKKGIPQLEKIDVCVLSNFGQHLPLDNIPVLFGWLLYNANILLTIFSKKV